MKNQPINIKFVVRPSALSPSTAKLSVNLLSYDYWHADGPQLVEPTAFRAGKASKKLVARMLVEALVEEKLVSVKDILKIASRNL